MKTNRSSLFIDTMDFLSGGEIFFVVSVDRFSIFFLFVLAALQGVLIFV